MKVPPQIISAFREHLKGIADYAQYPFADDVLEELWLLEFKDTELNTLMPTEQLDLSMAAIYIRIEAAIGMICPISDDLDKINDHLREIIKEETDNG